jgi:hypothetical protein
MSNFTFDELQDDDQDYSEFEGDCLTLKCPQCGATYDHPDCWNCGYIQDNRSPDEIAALEAEAEHE